MGVSKICCFRHIRQEMVKCDRLVLVTIQSLEFVVSSRGWTLTF